MSSAFSVTCLLVSKTASCGAHLTSVEGPQLADLGDDELQVGLGPAAHSQGVPQAGQRVQTPQLIQFVDEGPLTPKEGRNRFQAHFSEDLNEQQKSNVTGGV